MACVLLLEVVQSAIRNLGKCQDFFKKLKCFILQIFCNTCNNTAMCFIARPKVRFRYETVLLAWNPVLPWAKKLLMKAQVFPSPIGIFTSSRK